MSTFENDFDWQRRFLSEIKRILADQFVVEAPPEEDMRRNTDLMVLKLDTVRVACRVRTNWYLHQKDYRNEFTIRSFRPSGAETELAKVVSGWGDYIFYGFANSDDTGLAAWMLGDLKKFRSWHSQQLWRGLPAGIECPNGDGTRFRAYRIADMLPGFLVDRETAERDAADENPLPISWGA